MSGISGTGMGPLALMAKQAGLDVFGSDLSQGAVYDELVKAGIDVYIGEQDGRFLSEKLKGGVDWFVYTSALSDDHPELTLARGANIKCSKRDDFTAFLVTRLGLKMVAVAGTHGKTTTTAMIVWGALKCGLPVSHIVGSTLGFASSGAYHDKDRYFIYEADEYDKNFLKYHPWLAVIPIESYDHPDIYPTPESYRMAFKQFRAQCEKVIQTNDKGEIAYTDNTEVVFRPEMFRLAGQARRIDAVFAAEAILRMLQDDAAERGGTPLVDANAVVAALNEFPGAGRRMEKIIDGAYSDYAHHPEEIAATMNIAREQAQLDGRKGVVVVYQPHQNTRQHEIKDQYKDAFIGASKIFWLPTYLTRENPELPVIRPEEFIAGLSNANVAEPAEMNDELREKIRQHVKYDDLVLLMSAGPADDWFRNVYSRVIY